MKTRTAVALLALAAPLAAAVTAHAQLITGFTYTTNNGTISIDGWSGLASTVAIPSTIHGLPVTAIASASVFYNGYEGGVMYLQVPASVLSIAEDPFMANNLRAINVATDNPSYSSVNGVLFDKNQTTLIEYPNGLAHPGSYVIPGGVTTIGGYAFDSSALTSVTIPESVTNIGHFAFWISSLGSVAVPGSVTSIGDSAFGGSTSLTNVTLASGLTDIGPSAFWDCRITSITLPDSVTTIGDSAFSDCWPLTNVFIGSGLTDVDMPSAFIDSQGGSDLAPAFNVAPGNPLYSSAGGVLFNKNQTRLTLFPGRVAGSYTVPAGVTAIGAEAFLGSRLTSVTLPDNLTIIGDYAFSYSSLTSVTLPDSLTNIGDYAFSDSSLASIVLDTNLVSIGASAFSATPATGGGGPDYGPPAAGCPLASITIPNSVTSIGDSAFGYCASLTNVVIGSGVTNEDMPSVFIDSGAVPSVAPAFNVAPGNPLYSSVGGVLFNKNQTTLILFPGGVVGSYTVPAGVTAIGAEAFLGSQLTSVTVPVSLISIGDSAFADCANLTNVVLDDNLLSIGAGAFSGGIIGVYPSPGVPLTSITIPASVTNIGGGAFSLCTSLTRAYFLGDAPSADSGVFWAGAVVGLPVRDPTTAYYLPGTTGWAQFATNTGIPTALWLPQEQSGAPDFGVQSNQFGFTISWAPNRAVVVEAATDLSHPVWIPIATNNLSSSGTSYFSDPEWTNYPARYYRLRSP